MNHCWLAGTSVLIACCKLSPRMSMRIIISDDFYHHPGWGEDINTQTADGAVASLTHLIAHLRLRVLLLLGPCSVTPPLWPPGREPDDGLPPPLAASLCPSTVLHTLQTRCLSLSGWKASGTFGGEFLSWPTVDRGGDTWQGETWSWTRQAASWSPLLLTPRLEGYSHAFEAGHLSRLIAPIPVKAAQTANGLVCFSALY